MKILFICTHNRCRSILAEAIARYCGKGFLIPASTGSQPAGVVHPLSLEALIRHQIPADGLHSKSWNDLKEFNPDLVITVCDSAAAEACPVWLGGAVKVHWGLVDPSIEIGGRESVVEAFDQTISILTGRVEKLVSVLESQGPEAAIETAKIDPVK
jgi:arsenate reductase (thioredoxin)